MTTKKRIAPANNPDEPAITVYEPGPIPDPLSEVLSAYQVPANTLRVEVLRSHDGLYEGQVLTMPNDDRTAGLISGGFVMIVPPTILGVDTFR